MTQNVSARLDIRTRKRLYSRFPANALPPTHDMPNGCKRRTHPHLASSLAILDISLSSPNDRGKRKATAAEDASPSGPYGKSRKRRSEILGNFQSLPKRKRRPMDPEASRHINPLKEYFDDDLGLQSASDDPEDGDSAEEHNIEREHSDYTAKPFTKSHCLDADGDGDLSPTDLASFGQ
ncbi:hypothetical protein P692DRAFT_20880800 [Suillus brevipes Sb2]|nr:hypothetical protein P692DRAFT_20880800 [Suillus brevipes Sb2]